jgi:hypothetical protein
LGFISWSLTLKVFSWILEDIFDRNFVLFGVKYEVTACAVLSAGQVVVVDGVLAGVVVVAAAETSGWAKLFLIGRVAE